VSDNSCPFCGAEPKQNWMGKLRWFNCGTMVGPDNNRNDQTTQCVETEVGALKERIKLLEYGIAKQNLEIEQTCGRVLDYPWFKDDQKNFPGATEKDGVCVGEHVAETIAAELARKYTEAKDRIKRLEEAGDCLCEAASFLHWYVQIEHWHKAKEDKP